MTTDVHPEPVGPDGPVLSSTLVPAPPITAGEGMATAATTAVPALGPVDTGGRLGVRPGLLLSIGVGYAGLWVAFFTPVIISLQLQVRALDRAHETSALSVLLAISAVFSLATNPLAGYLSDRTTSRLGRRRPWLLTWLVVGMCGLSIQAFAPNLVVLNVGSVLGQVGFAGLMSVTLAVLPDHIPVRRRGTTSAVMGISQAVGIIIGAGCGGALAGDIAASYLVPAAIGTVFVLFFVVRLPDRQVDAGMGGVSLRQIAASYWVDPRRHPDFGWAWLSRFAMYMGLAAANNYLVFYLSAQLGLSTKQAAATVGVTTGVTAVSVVFSSAVAGALSDRLGRRKVLVAVAAVFGLVALCCFAFATSLPLVITGAVVIGIAQGAYAAVDLALVSEVLPDSERSASTHLGVITIANQLPQSLAPAFAPALLAIGVGSVVGAASGENYTALFAGSAVCALISAVTVFKVRSVR